MLELANLLCGVRIKCMGNRNLPEGITSVSAEAALNLSLALKLVETLRSGPLGKAECRWAGVPPKIKRHLRLAIPRFLVRHFRQERVTTSSESTNRPLDASLPCYPCCGCAPAEFPERLDATSRNCARGGQKKVRNCDVIARARRVRTCLN